jgi:predicted adenylyl cyclase CyaB
MPSNIEIKATLMDRSAAEATAVRLSDTPAKIIHQEDYFFSSRGARLKLRIFSSEQGELIRYERSDMADVRRSNYIIARTPDPKMLLEILSATLGVTGVVTKTRTLYRIGQTRVHLDEVKGLGDFLELEVVLQPGQNESDGKEIARTLLQEFGIDSRHLIAEAYVDLLARSAS